MLYLYVVLEVSRQIPSICYHIIYTEDSFFQALGSITNQQKEHLAIHAKNAWLFMISTVGVSLKSNLLLDRERIGYKLFWDFTLFWMNTSYHRYSQRVQSQTVMKVRESRSRVHYPTSNNVHVRLFANYFILIYNLEFPNCRQHIIIQKIEI